VEGCDGRHRNFIECSYSEGLFTFFDISPGRRVVGRLNMQSVEAISYVITALLSQNHLYAFFVKLGSFYQKW
jgi:hypothetical protein